MQLWCNWNRHLTRTWNTGTVTSYSDLYIGGSGVQLLKLSSLGCRSGSRLKILGVRRGVQDAEIKV